MNERIDLLRFPLIVGVAFIHVDGIDIDLTNASVGMDQSGYFSQFIRNFISQGLARIAVPLFFMMSGYLFFLNFEWSLELWTANCSFFVFAAHEPLLALLRKVSYKFLEPNTDVVILGLYLLTPVFVLAAAILSYVVFRAITPKFLSFVSGGR